jgi:hypothetical protein
VLDGVGGWTPHNRRLPEMMRRDDGWDVELRRASKTFGKPRKLMVAPSKSFEEVKESRPLARKIFGAKKLLEHYGMAPGMVWH